MSDDHAEGQNETTGPINRAALLRSARSLFSKGKKMEALSELGPLLGSSDSQAHFIAGCCCHDLSDYRKAKEYYLQASQDPALAAFAHYNLGLIFGIYGHDDSNRDLSVHHFRQAIKSSNPLEEAFLQLSWHETKGRAVVLLSKGVKLYPQSASLLERLCSLLLKDNPEQVIEKIKAARETGVSTGRLRLILVQANLSLGLIVEALSEVDCVDVSDERDLLLIRCLRASMLFRLQGFAAAENILTTVIEEDFANSLHYVAHFILICVRLKEGAVEQAISTFMEIPYNEDFGDGPPFEIGEIGSFDERPYIIEAVNGLADVDTPADVRAKVHLMRALNDLYDDQVARENFLKLDLEGALAVYSYDLRVKIAMANLLSDQGDWLNSARYIIEAQLMSNEDQYCRPDLEKIGRNKAHLKKLLAFIKEQVGSAYRGRERFAEFLLEDVVGFLSERKDYAGVADLANCFRDEHLLKANVLFKVAYSFAEIKDRTAAARHYECYIRNVGEDSGAMNNLGLLREESGRLDEARDLFSRALARDPASDRIKSNLGRVEEKLLKLMDEQASLGRAVHLFQQEDVSWRRALATLCGECAQDGLIYCKLGKIASLMKVSQQQARSQLDIFIKKRYFEEVRSSSSVDGIILKPNPLLVVSLGEELVRQEEERQAERIATELSSSALAEKYGYDKDLRDKLLILSSPELIKLLDRDLREVVTSLVTHSYKAAMVLCGSIMEAILLDRLLARKTSAMGSLTRIRARNGRGLSSKDKNLHQWTLTTLLDVAHEEDIVSDNLYHWGHGLRGFRNLVHPAVEQRREVEVSRDSAEVAWSVVRRMLNELV